MILPFLLFVISVSCGHHPSSVHTGAKITLNAEGVNFLVSEGFIPVVEETVDMIVIPDVSGLAKTPIGNVQYVLKDMGLDRAEFESRNGNMNPKTGTFETTVSTSLWLSFTYSIAQKSFPYMSDSGTGVVGGSATLDIAVTVIRDEATSGAYIDVPVIHLQLEDFEVNIDSSMSWLYDMIFNIFKEEIITEIEVGLTDALRVAIDDMLEYGKASLLPCYYFFRDVMTDARMTEERMISTSTHATFPMSYAAWKGYDDETCEWDESAVNMITPPPLPNTVNDKHSQVILSEAVVTSTYNAIASAGHFSTDINVDTSPPEWAYLTSMKYWSWIFEGLKETTPNSIWDVSVIAGNDIKSVFYSGAIKMENKYVISVVERGTSNVYELSLNVALAGAPVIVTPARFGLTFTTQSIKVIGWKGIGVTLADDAAEVLEDFSEDVLAVLMNEPTREGVWMSPDMNPHAPNVQMIDAEIHIITDGSPYLLHSANIGYKLNSNHVKI